MVCSADSRSAPGSCPLRRGPLELGLMSVAKLQVSLVRLVRSTMLELLPLCLFMDFCELTKPDSISPNQIGTPLSDQCGQITSSACAALLNDSQPQCPSSTPASATFMQNPAQPKSHTHPILYEAQDPVQIISVDSLPG